MGAHSAKLFGQWVDDQTQDHIIFRVRYFKICYIILTFLSLAPSAWTMSEDAPPKAGAAFLRLKEAIYNFDRMDPGVYRSGLIPEDAIPSLKDLGIKTVINFDNNTERAKKEEALLKLFGIYMIWMPWSGWDLPKDELIDKFLALMKTPDLKPILVHCKHGQERTGVALAIWRIAEQGWPADQAYQEMKSYHFRPFRYGHLKKYLYHYASSHGQPAAKIQNEFERLKTSVLSLIYQLRKLNPFILVHTVSKAGFSYA